MYWLFVLGVGFALGSYTTTKYRLGDIWQEVEYKVSNINRFFEGLIEDQLIPTYIREQQSIVGEEEAPHED